MTQSSQNQGSNAYDVFEMHSIAVAQFEKAASQMQALSVLADAAGWELIAVDAQELHNQLITAKLMTVGRCIQLLKS